MRDRDDPLVPVQSDSRRLTGRGDGRVLINFADFADHPMHIGTERGQDRPGHPPRIAALHLDDGDVSEGGYRPVHSGSRFSAKARWPSLKSSDLKITFTAALESAHASSSSTAVLA